MAHDDGPETSNPRRDAIRTLTGAGRSVDPCWNDAYPEELAKIEDGFVATRRAAARLGGASIDDRIGIAVSGGGIRSATFALGFFQALARAGFLRRVDYLSTVSGGSYFGAFFGGLFVERGGDSRSVEDVEKTLDDPTSFPMRWLRENGRYLAPAGGGDVIVAGASYLRNLVTIHITLGVLLLGLFLATFAVRMGVELPIEAALVRWATHGVWPSPYLAIPVGILVFFVVPFGWAYWLIPGQSVGARDVVPWGSVLLGVVLPWVISGHRPDGLDPAITTDAVLAGLAAVSALCIGRWKRKTLNDQQFGSARRIARATLSTWIAWAMVITVGCFAFAAIDTVGQSLYAYLWRRPDAPWSLWTGVPIAIAGALPAGAKWLFARLGQRAEDKPGVPLTVIATIAAVVIVGAHLVIIAVAAHGLGWGFHTPACDPGTAMKEGNVLCDVWTSRGAGHGVAALICCVVTSLLFGRALSLLNLSTFQAMYAGRLTRAYLGASNPTREKNTNGSRRISDPIPGDDIAFANYRPFDMGGPLHLINVTINETVDGETQAEYRDRKGIGMAVGPAGLSAGVRHHARWGDESRPARTSALFRRLLGWAGEAVSRPAKCIAPASGFRLFAEQSGDAYVEQLPVGSWVGISGAAFSTGLGYRTSIALSILAGFFNIRLGYWWDSRISPWKRAQYTPTGGPFDVGRALTGVLPVQSLLVDEWLARFRGGGRRLWNLSDGGHFENTAGYELIRRRLPFIILLDDGEDPDGRLEDLGNLVRKARIDFGAHIDFLAEHPVVELPSWIRNLLAADVERTIVSPAALRMKAGDPDRRSGGHAALARVTYAESTMVSWLLVVKPSLVGDEPLDVVQYRSVRTAFPQEPTTDQFFDEAQWESYRRLGEHIGRKLIAGRSVSATSSGTTERRVA
ncbi:MAG TPA: hypothetical protein VGR62_15530 [Candidatus Binatia bacterium]|jgi:hypothetical protein|nr:hypothetical protein [Candidatus Binatia bacterium]